MDFAKIATDFGLVAALLVAILLALYRMGKWLGTNVVKPLADRHLVFLERIEKVQIEQSLTLQAIARNQERQTEIQRDEVDQLKAIYIIAKETKEDQVRGRTLAVQQLQEDHAEILRRLPRIQEP